MARKGERRTVEIDKYLLRHDPCQYVGDWVTKGHPVNKIEIIK